MTTNTIARDIKAAFGIIIKEHLLFSGHIGTQLLLAESKGMITHAYRQFFMGHKDENIVRGGFLAST